MAYQEVPGDNWDYDSIADLMLVDLQINNRTRQVIMHAPKDGFFYVLDRVTGELISADPITKVSWASGIDMKTGKPNVNKGALYRTDAVVVKPGPSGGHVWQPWTYSPLTGLVNFPGTEIGPDGVTGNVLYAWDPIARKERWRVAGGGAGAFAGGSLSTAGNLVFSSVNDRLIAYRADTGEKLTEVALGTTQMGPPISFTIDGKRYIAVTSAQGTPAGAGGGGRGGAGGGAAAPARPAHLPVLTLDGKAPLPGTAASN